MKKLYTKPNMNIERFVANEVIAICTNISCSRSGTWESPIRYHNPNNCGDEENQILRQNTDGTYTLWEYGNGNPRECKIYSDANYTNQVVLTDLQAGQVVYWTNTFAGITYHHYGTAQASDPNRPNHS